MEQLNVSLRYAGLLALLGALLYAIGDVLLLAGKFSIDDYPRLKPFVKLLSDAEKMVVFPPHRLITGALLGVFVTPLILAGYWQIYIGRGSSATAWALVTFILFACASIIGTFVHGTFYYLGEYVHVLNQVQDDSQPVIANMISRHRKVLIVTYARVMIFVVIASIIFSVLVAMGKTFFPVWMAAINPITITILWLLLKRILPQIIRERKEGAGFNIAFLLFFACTTATLWNG